MKRPSTLVPVEQPIGERVAIITQHLNELSELTKRIWTTDKVEKDDLVGQMLIYYMFKQLDHAMSIPKLSPFADTALIARTMIEGFFNIIWMLESPEERSKDWFDFHKVVRYQMLSDPNLKLEPEQIRQQVIVEYEALDGRFERPNSKKPYDNFRRGDNLGNIVQQKKAKFPTLPAMYELYQKFSDWTHWGKASLSAINAPGQDDSWYYEDINLYSVPAAYIAFHCLLETALLFCAHFKLAGTEQLNQAHRALMVALGGTTTVTRT